jgi:signal transduction histidine kinase
LAGRTLKPIKDMMDEQSRFIIDSSHELRTPLTSLKSEIEVGLRDKNLSLADAKKLLQSNLEEVNNLQYLSDNLIKLTQYEKSNGNLFEDFDLSETVKEAVKKVAGLSKNKKIIIKNAIKYQQINGDKQGLMEMFVIFLDNAIKYSSNGKTVTLLSEKIDGSINIDIKDQGVGIDEKDISHVFDRFFRADKSRTKADVSGY